MAQSAELQAWARSRTEARGMNKPEPDKSLLTQKLGMITFSKRKKLTVIAFSTLKIKRSSRSQALDKKGLRRTAQALDKKGLRSTARAELDQVCRAEGPALRRQSARSC